MHEPARPGVIQRLISKPLDKTHRLQQQLLISGIAGAIIGGLLFNSVVAGFAFLVLVCCVGAVWRRDESQILAFCVAYQWLFIATGYLFQRSAGFYPGFRIVGDVERAVLFSLIGMIALVIGIRVGLFALTKLTPSKKQKAGTSWQEYDVERLFWCVIGLYAVGWFVEISPMDAAFNVAQLIYRVLEFRTVMLFMLFLAIFKQGRGYGYGLVALVFTTIPTLASEMSAFSGGLTLVFLALLSELRFWSKSPIDRRRNYRIIGAISATVVVLSTMALIWQGGVKFDWRNKITTGLVVGSPTEKANAFLSSVDEGISNLDIGLAAESLAERTSSGPVYFSFVMERVPSTIPHEGGALVLRALEHTFQPRFLFPNKPNLGGDSWLILKYAGFKVAGEESGTSVGLGYMAEFYIDFGVSGMFVALLIYGVLIGLAYRGLILFSPSHSFYISAVTVMFGQHFVSYEGEIAKLLGGFVQTFIVFAVLLRVLGPWLHRNLVVRGVPQIPALQPSSPQVTGSHAR